MKPKNAEHKNRKPSTQFIVCINGEISYGSLEFGKPYKAVSDDEAAEHGYMTVIDGSGEGYWYTAQRFSPVEVPAGVSAPDHLPHN